MRRSLLSNGAILSLALLGACTTVPTPQNGDPIVQTNPVADAPTTPNAETTEPDAIVVAEPLPKPPLIVEIFAPPTPTAEPPIIEIFEQPKWYDTLAYWQSANVQPALTSFKPVSYTHLTLPTTPYV